MHKTRLIMLLAVFVISCAASAHYLPHNGDIVFHPSQSSQSLAIQHATHSPYSFSSGEWCSLTCGVYRCQGGGTSCRERGRMTMVIGSSNWPQSGKARTLPDPMSNYPTEADQLTHSC